MGSVPSTPRRGGAYSPETAEYLIGTFVGDTPFPLSSEFWQKLLELPLNVQWSTQRVQQACELLAKNNCHTRHLAKILFHLACCLQEYMSSSGALPLVYEKAFNAVYISSIFLKHLIESVQGENIQLYLSLEDNEDVQKDVLRDQTIENLVMRNVLSFIASVEVSPDTFLLHLELLNFMIIGMSTQLLCGPSPGPNDVNPFLDAAMAQDSSLVGAVVCRLLLNFMARSNVPSNRATYSILYDGNQSSVLQRVGSAAVDRVDIEGNAHSARHIKLPFASLFDTLGICLADEAAVLLLYSLLQGNSAFLEYVLVRTDLDALLMPILEALYNAPSRTANQIYMLLIILLILSQDSSFNASIHKLILTGVPWYKERLFHQTSLGSLMVIILSRTVQYNLSKLRDVYLQTTCLATLANMAPHVHRLSAYASQRLVSLFDMLSRKYNKLAERRDNKLHIAKGNSVEGNNLVEDMILLVQSTELHIYTDFLRLVLEIINAILTYALPRNPEVVYAIMHRQEVFQPFKNHPRFNELIDNIYTVLDFFNSRMDAQREDGDWSVHEVLQVIIVNCRSWRGDGMKMFTQLRFTYEQESHPEEFFIPYVWQLVLSHCGFSFNTGAINLFPVDLQTERLENGVVGSTLQNGDFDKSEYQLDP
ncbi:dymeclin isoform X3 [Glycine max]|uniref:dymeclin isoform X3 n=1 Tax=Glycine max TaxID=3847 RepID=UPI0007192BC3|nr:dymeclin isoform X3 [Glycine max]|eukprot:XP_014628393.1 dymeclin isoform X3 [Glycine max]